MKTKRVEAVVERTVGWFVHPRNPDAKLYGIRLEAGDVIQTTDMYSSSNGSWEFAPCPGLTLQAISNDPIWVR